jgi:hypothetical protein
MSEPANSFDDELSGIYRKRRLCWIPLALTPFFLTLAALFAGEVGRIFANCGIGCFITYMIGSLVVSFSVCPRCQKSAFYKGFWQNSFSPCCLHCGLLLKPQVEEREQAGRGDGDKPPN